MNAQYGRADTGENKGLEQTIQRHASCGAGVAPSWIVAQPLRSTIRNIENYGEIAATTATEKNTGKRPRYAAKTENYREKRPENRENGLYEPKNAIFRLFLWFSRPPGMKIRKNESVEQGVAPYGAQGAPPVNADVR